MGMMGSQITRLFTQQFIQAQIEENIDRWPVISPPKWQVTRKMFPFDDVIMQIDSHGAGKVTICSAIYFAVHRTRIWIRTKRPFGLWLFLFFSLMYMFYRNYSYFVKIDNTVTPDALDASCHIWFSHFISLFSHRQAKFRLDTDLPTTNKILKNDTSLTFMEVKVDHSFGTILISHHCHRNKTILIAVSFISL